MIHDDDPPDGKQQPAELLAMAVGGRWVAAVAGATYTVSSPVSGRPVARLPAADPADIDLAVSTATEAFRRRQDETAFTRAGWCRVVAEAILARSDELAAELIEEHGKPLAEASAEVGLAVEGFRLAAEEATRIEGRVVPVADPDKRVFTTRHARGVLAVVTPFNFPLNIPVEYLGAALATGNAVVWKPAPTTARIAVRLMECIEAAGIPPGLVNLVTGPSLEMSRHLVSHPGVAGVCFTGSSEAGEAIARLAGGKHLLLELGGNGPSLVLEDADLDRAAAAAAQAAFFNAGQSCAAAGRILCAPEVTDELTERLASAARAVRLGDPRLAETTMGPVHLSSVAGTMDRHIEDAVARGACVAAGGCRAPDMPTDLYYRPTVLASVPNGTAVREEETFGPLAPVSAVDGGDDALVAAANAGRLGLSCAVFTRDAGRALRLAERLECGQVVVNDTSNYWELHMPFGGWPGKGSGLGRLGGRHTLEELTEVRTIAIDLRRSSGRGDGRASR